MTREEVTKELLESTSHNFLLEIATGYGKSKLSLDKMASLYKPHTAKILIVVYRRVHINNWKAEITKWGYEKYLQDITISTYRSIGKHIGDWDMVILDECHHTSDLCKEQLEAINSKNLIGLSATITPKLFNWFYTRYSDLKVISVDLPDAIKEGVLPEPKIICIKLNLDNTIYNRTYIQSTSGKMPKKRVFYADRKKMLRYGGPVEVACTQRQYYNCLDEYIMWAKKKRRDVVFRTKSLERLKWEAKEKEPVIKDILKVLSNYRTLTFCPSIEDSISLGYPCVNSKVGIKALEEFNTRKIKHLSAVGMLDESVNLTSCRVGILQMINAADRLSVQRVGRILRHKQPIVIIPYYTLTREEEIVNDFLAGYDEKLITTVTSFAEFKALFE